MTRLLLLLVLLPTIALCADYAAPGPYQFSELTGEWRDAARKDRVVPYRIYLPKDAPPAPVIVFSHGLGGSRDGYRYFGEHMASHGYASVHLQHAGSDTQMLRDAIAAGEQLPAAMRKAATNLSNAMDRPKDVSFALDQLTGMKDLKLDLKKVAVAGHSFGAYTTLAIAGQGAQRSFFRDERVSAAIAMSAPAPKPPASYAPITIPVLVMTGTLDDSPLLDSKAEDRIEAFETFKGKDQLMIVFDGGDHMVFSGRAPILERGTAGRRGDAKRDPEFQAHIKRLSLAFLEYTLKGDATAREVLGKPRSDYSVVRNGEPVRTLP